MDIERQMQVEKWKVIMDFIMMASACYELAAREAKKEGREVRYTLYHEMAENLAAYAQPFPENSEPVGLLEYVVGFISMIGPDDLSGYISRSMSEEYLKRK